MEDPAEDLAPGSQAHTRTVSGVQYSLWLDQHGPEEVAKYVRSALEACAPAARGQAGFDDVYPLMLRLCSPSPH